MQTRHVIGVAALGGILSLSGTGCSTPEPALGGTTATVTIDGSETGGARPIRCYQSGWTWYIETPQKENGFTAVLETGDDVSPKSVDLRGVGDFTGSYWANHIGNAEVTGDDGKFTISGSAAGNFDQDPMTAVTANFRIEADC
ncbi:MAG: lipoprotein LpqH [Mycobacterium sp.]|nr:lipoprotein LpqH [Mycobacterium sp.]